VRAGHYYFLATKLLGAPCSAPAERSVDGAFAPPAQLQKNGAVSSAALNVPVTAKLSYLTD
jgi:hypothetical protein